MGEGFSHVNFTLAITNLNRNLINLTAPEFQLYLAIKDSIYENFFQREAIQEITKINQLLLIIIDIDQEKIVQWIN